jgi:hypothetical protein
MIDEPRERAAAERGRHARALLDDPLLVEAFASVDAALVEAWRATPQRDVEARERFHLATTLLGKVKAALGEVATNGEMSAATLRGISGERQGIVARMVGR